VNGFGLLSDYFSLSKIKDPRAIRLYVRLNSTFGKAWNLKIHFTGSVFCRGKNLDNK
jgi:hypothetical protein